MATLFVIHISCSDDSPTAPVPDPPVYKIAFVIQDNGHDIWAINPDGTELTQLTDSYEDESNPIWSPAGRYIYYQTMMGSQAEVIRMNADGSNRVNVSDHAAWDWLKDISSDGQKMVFESDRAADRQLFVMDLTDSSLIALTPAAHDGYGSARFTPNGKMVVCSAAHDSREMYVVSIADTTRTKISDNSGTNFSIVVSPDGQRAAYLSRRDGTDSSDIWVCGIDGSDHASVSNSSNYNGYPSWSPNGQKITYIESISGTGTHISTADYDGFNRMLLTDTATSVFCSYPRWSPDGTQIVYTSSLSGDYGLYIMNADGTGRTELTTGTVRIETPVWSPAL